MKIVGSVKTLFFYPFSFIRKNHFDKKYFFLSFGDAILFLFKKERICTSDLVLVPNFFCQATLKFISQYAHPIFYKINDDFTIDKDSYFEQIKKYNPRIIINYSLLGFSLDQSEQNMLKALCKTDTIIIEDFASQIMSEHSFHPINNRHYAIDSIRKHCNILGSHLLNYYGTTENVSRISWYKTKCHVFKLLQNLLYFFAHALQSKNLYNLGYSFFLMLDDIIGEPKKPNNGSHISCWLYNGLDLKKIQTHYGFLVSEYNKKFKLLTRKYITTIPDKLLDNSNISNYYPLLISPLIRDSLLKTLKKHNVFSHQLWEWDSECEFNSFLKKNLYDSLVVFPLSFTISHQTIEYIYNVISNFLNTVEKNNI